MVHKVSASHVASDARDEQTPAVGSSRPIARMTDLEYRRPTSLDDAVTALATPGARALGGGTELLPALRDARTSATRLVDLRAIGDLNGLTWDAAGSLRIGAATCLTAVARHPLVRERFPALAQACAAVGSLQLRNMGTIGGNLGQRVRCWYFRHGFECYKNRGARCSASTGDSRYHSVFTTGGCLAAHPSDPAVALTALEAVVDVVGPTGRRSIALADLFVIGQVDREIAVEPNEIIVSVGVPAAAAGPSQAFWKVMQRGAWDFALVSLAASRRRDGAVRMVLGGVAARPWRVPHSVEEDVASGSLSDDDIETLAERALYDARPTSPNAYKVRQAAALLRRGIRFLMADQAP